MSEPNKRPRPTAGVFVGKIADPGLRRDCRTLMGIMTEVTGQQPQMWGDTVIGFGNYPHTEVTGRVVDRPLVSFSPRADDVGVYIVPEFRQRDELLAKLGSHEVGESGVYLRRLEAVGLGVLEQLLKHAVKEAKRRR